ncbi:hypothetical protein PAESOLCIP111_04011 [Paenibacillus solanacearum]|uniref:Uncharacterized protein n=1 Tax=Paenibacillus solanacearum TaxID=2048548 RepID=A0A916NQN4_9BACL|nr:CBO0543 family protein [Paenibacillus solanacearum]CAG7639116.1 hypothetical protein PAESOLCIP111_04011 [Paenibacillus solanacearum]
MAEVIGVSSWLIAGWLWGDWRNWRKYHETILYMLLGDTLYYYISIDKRLWSIMPQPPFQTELMALLGEFVVFTCAMLIYLGRFPNRVGRGWLWVLFWIGLFTANEALLLRTGTFAYKNEWSLVDSLFFCLMMFPMLRLHHKKPLLAYGISVLLAAAYIYLYDIPVR